MVAHMSLLVLLLNVLIEERGRRKVHDDACDGDEEDEVLADTFALALGTGTHLATRSQVASPGRTMLRFTSAIWNV